MMQEKRQPSTEQVLANLTRFLQYNIKCGYQDVDDDTLPEAPPRKYVVRQFQHLHIADYSQFQRPPNDPFGGFFGDLIRIWLIDIEDCRQISTGTYKQLISTMPRKSLKAHKSFDIIARLDFSYDQNLGEERRAYFLGSGHGRQVVSSGLYLTEDGSIKAENFELEWIGG